MRREVAESELRSGEPALATTEVDGARGRAAAFLARCEELVRADLPAGALLFDAHTHLGTDIDGMRGRPDELLGAMDRYGFAGAFTFCLDEPDREPSFRAANDRTLAYAGQAPGRLVPFVRLDLARGAVDEASRCLALGARGIKLHPRAQRFSLDDERLAPVFELAAEARVPILIHGGRGLPPIADHLAALVRRCQGVQLVVAHAGIADMAALAGHFGGVPGVYFDTSVWSAVDLLDLFRRVAPEQVLFATDYPYGRLPNALLLALRAARVAGLDERQVRGMLGETAAGISEGTPPPPLSAPRGSPELVQPFTFARIHQYVAMATPLLWTGQPDAIGGLGLAVNAAREENGRVPEADWVREALELAGGLWQRLPAIEDGGERHEVARTAIALVHAADVLAVTAAAP